jgi:hypothetical protein
VHRCPFSAVEQAELDSRAIDRLAHQSTEGIDLSDDLSLGNPADGRVATHLSDRIEIPCKECYACAEPSGRSSSLGPGMPGADDDHVIFVLNSHGCFAVKNVVELVKPF